MEILTFKFSLFPISLHSKLYLIISLTLYSTDFKLCTSSIKMIIYVQNAANKLYIKFANKVMMESDQFTGITVKKLNVQ